MHVLIVEMCDGSLIYFFSYRFSFLSFAVMPSIARPGLGGLETSDSAAGTRHPRDHQSS